MEPEAAPIDSTSKHGDTHVRELAARRNGGVQVTLFWDSSANSVFVEVECAGARLRVLVDPADALEAYADPHAYRSRARAGGLSDRGPGREQRRYIVAEPTGERRPS